MLYSDPFRLASDKVLTAYTSTINVEIFRADKAWRIMRQDIRLTFVFD